MKKQLVVTEDGIFNFRKFIVIFEKFNLSFYSHCLNANILIDFRKNFIFDKI